VAPIAPKIVGIGELLWDEYPEGRQMGGAPANFAYHCQVLGAQSLIVSAVGQDEAGQDLREALSAQNLDTSHVYTYPGYPTGSVSVDLDPKGIPAYTIHEPVAWDFLQSTLELQHLASQAHAVCFGTLAQRSPVSRTTIQSFLRATQPTCIRIFDINLRQKFYDRSVIVEGLSLASVLKLNEDELVILAHLLGLNGSTHDLLGQLATQYSLNAVALTMAERGCMVRTNDAVVHLEGVTRGPVIDTVGAGDCWTAVLIMGMLNKDPVDEIAARANWQAAYVCTQQGAMPKMP
jgi:fructokinase